MLPYEMQYYNRPKPKCDEGLEMTGESKEVLRKLFQKYDPRYDYSGHEISERDMNVISDFTLSIIEQAVDAERPGRPESYIPDESARVAIHVQEEFAERILSRVKGLLYE